MKSFVDRFWARVDRTSTPDGCWPWVGATSSGYGVVALDGEQRQATHVAWELENEQPFPSGLLAMHSCDNPPCVRPSHLSPGTHEDNLQDMWEKGRGFTPWRDVTHCIRGHEFTRENTYNYRGKRYCRECRCAADRKYKDKVRAIS